jgi:asparagine synthase (glutamine-hydrolysing)
VVQKLFESMEDNKRGGIACWQLLFYALWHRVHIEGGRSDLPVIEALEGAT